MSPFSQKRTFACHHGLRPIVTFISLRGLPTYAERVLHVISIGRAASAGGGVRPVAAIVAGPDGVKVHALALEAGLNAERLAKLLTAKGDKETTE